MNPASLQARTLISKIKAYCYRFKSVLTRTAGATFDLAMLATT
jgi:hypothetical protein